MTGGNEITLLLHDWSNGDHDAGDVLMSLVYDELHKRSANLFRGETPGHTIQPTALINEAYVRLVKADIDWRNRAHFFAMASKMMRRLLIDHAKSRSAQKRGGDHVRITFDELVHADPAVDVDLLDLTRALDELKKADPRKAEFIDLHYFGGLTVEEIQHVTGVSTATIGRDLRFARAWLSDILGAES